jgi:hypothetical protein
VLNTSVVEHLPDAHRRIRRIVVDRSRGDRVVGRVDDLATQAVLGVGLTAISHGGSGEALQ